MYIKPNEKLAGHPKRKIRDMFRQGMSKLEGWGLGLIQENLGISFDEARKISRELERQGFIRRKHRIFKRGSSNSGELDRWELTAEGQRLAKASIHRISRTNASGIIQELLKRIEQANNNPFAYTISYAVLFGSYLTKKQCLGDIDIGIKLIPKITDPDKQSGIEEARIRQAEAAGKHFDDEPTRRAWPQDEVVIFLDNNISHLDLNDADRIVQLGCLYKVIYSVNATAP
jgi:predicted nucleotidyltransferase